MTLKELYIKQNYSVTEYLSYLLVGFSAGSIDFIAYDLCNTVPVDNTTAEQLFKQIEADCSNIACREVKIIARGGLSSDFFNELCFQGKYVYDNKYVYSLMTNSHIELLAHNEYVSAKVNYHFKKYDLGAVIQATGTGKSYIIAKYISEIPKNEKILLLTPNTIIGDEIKKALKIHYDNVKIMTFQGLAQKNIKEIKVEHFIIDEFHHSESDIWGAAVKGVIVNNPGMKVLGTTATPVRPSDDINVVQTLFNNRLISEFNLSAAIHSKILPTPIIIQGIYNIETTLNDYQSSFKQKKSNLSKKQAEKVDLIMNQLINNLDSYSVATILREYLTKQAKHLLVFCSSITEIRTIRDTVKAWFNEAGFSLVNIFTVHSNKNIRKNKDIINEFQKEKNGISLLFSVDMLAEGLHLKNLDGAIFLRKTSSYIVCLQQLGRTLKAGRDDNPPIVFDFVNNVNEKGFLRNYIGAPLFPNSQKIDTEGKKISDISIIDSRIENVVRQLREIEKIWCASNIVWNKRLDEVIQYLGEHENRFPTPKTDETLYNWCVQQRVLFKNSRLSEDQIQLLNSIKFNWNETYKMGSWEERFDELKRFIQMNNTLPTLQTDKTLSGWISRQRADFKKGILEEEKIERLNSIKFNWNETSIRSWEERFDELKCFIQMNNTLPTLQTDETLSRWVSRQRADFKKGILEEEKIERLNSIKFNWNETYKMGSWEERFDELKCFIQMNNTLPTPKTNRTLYNWCVRQRGLFKNSRLSEDQIQLLNSIKFNWNETYKMGSWEERFDELKRFIQMNNTLPTLQTDKTLSGWISRQRADFKKGILEEEKIERLNSIKFNWNETSIRSWEERFDELKCFIQMNNTLPTLQTDETLSGWVSRQRADFKKGILEEEKIERLNSIKFNWNETYKMGSWEERFDELKCFIQMNNTLPTPKTNRTLYNWCVQQRVLFKNSRLSEDQIQLLDSIKFNWNETYKMGSWEERFDELKRFIQMNNTLPTLQTDKTLSRWVSRQRADFKKGILEEEKIERLNSIKFNWNETSIRSWEERFDELKCFIQMNNTLPTLQTDETLSRWVSRQRADFKKGILEEEKIERLNSIKFNWNETSIRSWEERFDELKCFIQMNNTLPTPKTNRTLYNWCVQQRVLFKNSRLSEDQIQLLDSIKFNWNRKEF